MNEELGSFRIASHEGGRNGETFERAWKDMGLRDSIPLSELYRLLEKIDMVRHQRRRMTNDPGVVLLAQTLIHRVQDMIGRKTAEIDILKEDSVMMLGWIVSEGGSGGGGIFDMGIYQLAGERSETVFKARRFSLYDSDDTSDEETESLMEVDGMGFKRSLSVPSSICESHDDVGYTKLPVFNLCEILDDLEEYHHKIYNSFVIMDCQLERLKHQNEHHLKYLRNVRSMNDGLSERVTYMRHEMAVIEEELKHVSQEKEDKTNAAELPNVTKQINLIGSKMTQEDNEIYQRLSQSMPFQASSNVSVNSTPVHDLFTINMPSNILTIIAFISIIILIMSHLTSK